MNNNINGLSNLMKITKAIIGTAFVALTGNQIKATTPYELENNNSKTTRIEKIGKVKPMPVLKLNFNNIENSQFFANHRSHSSHSSHSSHRSHYSHRSGSMFT